MNLLGVQTFWQNGVMGAIILISVLVDQLGGTRLVRDGSRLTGERVRLSGSLAGSRSVRNNKALRSEQGDTHGSQNIHENDRWQRRAPPPRSVRCPSSLVRAGRQAGNIAFFVKNVTNPFWKACRIGAEKAGKELGVSARDVAPTKPDNIEEQTRLVEDWIVKKPDAFVFVPVDYKALVPSIQKANKAGIPDRRLQQPDDRHRSGHVHRLGRRVDRVPDLQATCSSRWAARARWSTSTAFPPPAPRRPARRGSSGRSRRPRESRFSPRSPANYRRLRRSQVFENLMQRFPEIDAVVSANDDMAVGVAEIARRGRSRRQDQGDRHRWHSDATAAIAAGKMFATVDFSGHDQAYLAVTAAVRQLQQPAGAEGNRCCRSSSSTEAQRQPRSMKTPEERRSPELEQGTSRALEALSSFTRDPGRRAGTSPPACRNATRLHVHG